MSKQISLAFIVCASLAVGALSEEPRYLVKLAPTATMGDPEALATRLARTYGATLESINGSIVTVRLSPSRAALLGRDPNVESITTAAAPEKIASNGIDWNTGVRYEYDGSGNVKKIGTDTFSYDVVGRLVEAHTGGVRRQYEYDAFGNRTTCTDASGANCQDAETISALNNRSSAMTYSAAGDVIAHASHTYTFDEFHMLASDTYGSLTREFIYNAHDQRIGTLTSAPTGSWWRWTFRDPLTGKVLREFTSQGLDGRNDWKWEKDYIWRDGLLLATIQPKVGGTGTTTYHYHLDHLGTPRRITDDADVIVGIHDYHAFGPEVLGGSNERSLSLMKYTGHERDVVDGHPDALDYMMARYYSPTLGRFLSVDLARHDSPASPQSWNRYAYALNNPIRLVDPDGRKSLDYRILHVRVNVVYSNADQKGFFASRTLRQRTEAGIKSARQYFNQMGISLSFRRFEGSGIDRSSYAKNDPTAKLVGSVSTGGGTMSVESFVNANRGSALNVFVSGDLSLGTSAHGATKFVSGVPAFSLLPRSAGEGTLPHEIAHALGNTLGDTDNPAPGANDLTDVLWFFERQQYNLGIGFSLIFEEWLREGAEKLDKEEDDDDQNK